MLATVGCASILHSRDQERQWSGEPSVLRGKHIRVFALIPTGF